MAKIKEPKLVGVNKHNKISEPKREETLNRYLNWKYYNKNRSNKYISKIKKALYDLPEIQEAIVTKEELEDAAEAVTRVQLGRGYGVEYFDIRDLPEFTWNNQSTICLVEDKGQTPQKDVLLYSLDSELGEAIEDYEEYKEIISDDRIRVRNLLNTYDDWSELFAKYPIFRNLWEEDLDELYPRVENAAWRKKKADRLVGVELPKAGLTGADKKAQEIINQFNAVIDKVDLEKVHLFKRAEEDHWGESESTIFNRAVVMSTPEFEKAIGLANQIIENLKSNPSFIRSTNLAAKYANVIPTFNYVRVTFGYDSLERRIEVPTYVGLKESNNSSQRIPYRLGTNLTNIPADLKVGSFQECIDFTVDAMQVEEIARAATQAFDYDAQRIFIDANTVSLKKAIRANEKAVAIYNKLKEEGFPKWNIFEDTKYDLD